MPQCICPSCKTYFSVSSSRFGEKYRCNSCSTEFTLDVAQLARYQLPNIIRIQLRNIDGTPFTRFPIPVAVDYGYQLPPLRSDANGRIMITKEMFLKAQRDETSTGIMDHKGDYSLNRLVRIGVLRRSQAIAVSSARLGSQWPILDFEKELYGDMHSLIEAYVPDQEVVPVETTVDLSEANDVVYLELRVSIL